MASQMYDDQKKSVSVEKKTKTQRLDSAWQAQSIQTAGTDS